MKELLENFLAKFPFFENLPWNSSQAYLPKLPGKKYLNQDANPWNGRFLRPTLVPQS